MCSSAVSSKRTVDVGIECESRNDRLRGVAISRLRSQFRWVSADEGETAGERAEQRCTTSLFQPIFSVMVSGLIANGAPHQIAMVGLALLPVAALFGIGPIGRLNVGFAKRSIPGSVAVSGKKVCLNGADRP